MFLHIVQPYDCNKHFTLTALKRLERVANVPVLSDRNLKEKLPKIKTYAGFSIQNNCGIIISTSTFLQYMHSWLSAYEDKKCTKATEPTWSNLLDALRFVDLTELATDIEDCLKKAPDPVISQTEDKEGEYNSSHKYYYDVYTYHDLSLATGFEEMHKLQTRLKSLHDQLQINSEETGIPQEVKHCVDASYKHCFDVARKIEQEQSALRDDINALTKDKSQLMKEKNQHLEEIEHLKRELAERGIIIIPVMPIILLLCILSNTYNVTLIFIDHPPIKRQCVDGASIISPAGQ